MSLILAFDTCSTACEVALVRDGEVLAEGSQAMSRGYAAALMPLINRIMEEANATLSSLGTIGVTIGPGSFTGIRTGIATAQGLALASEARPVGISTLHAVSWRALEETDGRAPVLCVLDTRRTDYYAQAFRTDGQPETEPEVVDGFTLCNRLETRDFILAGDAAPRLMSDFPDRLDHVECSPGDGRPAATDIARLSERLVVEGLEGNLTPLYLRPPEATPLSDA